MPDLPRDRSLDATPALLREGYAFISRRCDALGSDAFETRLMLRRAVCARGEEAARVFYEPGRFTRQGAVPPPVLKLLQGEGSVASLDGAAHRRRKAMFMALMTRASIDRLRAYFAEAWRHRLPAWEDADGLVLMEAMHEVLCQAVCAWVGAPLPAGEVPRRSRELAAMIDGAGAIGPRHWRARALRARHERWARSLIRQARSSATSLPDQAPLAVIARHGDGDGILLDPEIAARELINLLRPTVAVARFIVFAALALHRHPEWRRQLQEDDAAREMFAQEVRRFYPFFPAVGGRVLQPFQWRGRRFDRGTWFLLDLYGTNHDPCLWEAPESFRPERFRRREENPFDLIPQGGGDHHRGHRCPGEWIAIDLVKDALRLLTAEMTYELPPQDLDIDLARVPARPASGLVLSKVRGVS